MPLEMDEMELDRYITARLDTEHSLTKRTKESCNMRAIEWWKGTANHLWRSYFVILTRCGNDPDQLVSLSGVDRMTYNLCKAVRDSLPVPSDIDIIRMYYTTPKGQELSAVEQYAHDHNLTTQVVWNALRHANRAVIEELGLLDKKTWSP